MSIRQYMHQVFHANRPVLITVSKIIPDPEMHTFLFQANLSKVVFSINTTHSGV